MKVATKFAYIPSTSDGRTIVRKDAPIVPQEDASTIMAVVGDSIDDETIIDWAEQFFGIGDPIIDDMQRIIDEKRS